MKTISEKEFEFLTESKEFIFEYLSEYGLTVGDTASYIDTLCELYAELDLPENEKAVQTIS